MLFDASGLPQCRLELRSLHDRKYIVSLTIIYELYNVVYRNSTLMVGTL